MPVSELKVRPSSVELRSGETQAFEAYESDGKPAIDLKWSVVESGVGAITADSGVYSAPGRVFRARRLAVIVHRADGSAAQPARGSAVVDLDPSRTWVPLFGGGWVVLFLLLLLTLLVYWPTLCLQCSPSGLFVNPPVVTLTKGQAQQFLASASATWTNTVNLAGLYIAPSAIEAEQVVNVTANSTSDPRQSAMGIVRLSPVAGLSVLPSKVTVMAGREVQLTASLTGAGQVTPTWLPPAVGTISPKGIYKAPEDSSPQAIVVMAQAEIPASATTPGSMLLAGALVSITPNAPGPCETPSPASLLWRVILLVAGFGALGGLTHAMGSFGTYVGNRELKASWLWWYGLKPALSAAVAVLVFLVFRAGLGAPDLGLEAADCLQLAGFAGLVGLFAEPATVKLKDIFEAIFTPRRDPREDRAGQAAGTPSPAIVSIEPRTLKASEATPLTIVGRNFADGCAVQIGTRSFATTRVSASELKVDIPANALTPGTLVVTVANKPPGGDVSPPDKVVVEA